MTYFIYSFLYIFGGLSSLFSNTRIRKILCYMSFVILALVCGMRDVDVGTDTYSYHRWFRFITEGRGEVRSEPIYLALNWLAYYIYNAPEVIVFLAAAVTMLFYSFSFSYFSVSYALSFSIFLGQFGYFFSFNGVRQGIAVAIITFAFRCLYYNRLAYVALVFFAAGFHVTALVMLPFVFINAFRFDNKFLFFLIISWSVSILFLVYPPLIRTLLSSLSFLISDGFVSYILSSAEYNSITLRIVLNQLFFLGGVLVMYRYRAKLRDRDQLVIILSLIGILLFNILNQVDFASRLAYYPYIFVVFSLPLIINCLFLGYQRVLVTFLFYTFWFFNFLKAIAINTNGVNPYSLAPFWFF
ncbi:EpsG family protein [Aliivibrio finisterrensis]|uniref:EpsG family protein n=1 Tax=Aliivibrio finisterrensis TaxID=511998 RepID=UPI001022468B|nr:EpsG family protein [Aliivibrio finisterrensis]RYU65232.1 EpsG family protein [Aliivibrio finisterrensis]RYU68606.1 EpsG family protein [Aliivibrio finisterrensis]RYU72003.1 EpsG family protein [Aliivibrio finisterrensis]